MKRGKGVEYLAIWKGFGPNENLWKLEDHLEHCKLKDRFEKQLSSKSPPKKIEEEVRGPCVFPLGFFRVSL
jgi:hypothetical protein